MPKPIIDRRSSAVVTPPVIPGAYLTQTTMPTEAQAWAPGEAPTITFATAPTVSGGESILPTDSRIKHTGRATTGVVEASTPGYWRSPYMADKTPPLASTDLPFLPRYGAKVRTTSPVVEVKMKQRSDLDGKTGSTTRIPIMLKVNGQYVTRRPIYLGPGNIGYAGTFAPSFIEDGTPFYLRLAFATSADRTIEVITMTEYGGFSIPSGYSFADAAAARFRAVVIGDSLTGGEKHGQGNWSLTSPEGKLQHATYTHLSSMWAYACQTLGYDNVIVSSAGSSGFAISGDTVNYSTASRVQNDAVGLDPHLFVVGTPFNDIANALGGGSVTPATVQANATGILNTLKSKVPNAIRVILGAPTPPVIGGASGASIVAPWNSALKAAALATGSWFIDPTLGDLFNPAGTRVLDRSNMIVGNEAYVSSDGTHPTQAGADFFGSGYIAEFLKACHPVGTIVVTPPPTTPDPTPTPENPGTTPPPSSGNRPALVKSKGSNGTHYPEDLPWLGDTTANTKEITLPSTLSEAWAALQNKIQEFTPAQVDTGTCVVRVRGNLPGYGNASSDPNAIVGLKPKNYTGTRKVLIVPDEPGRASIVGASANIGDARNVALFGFGTEGGANGMKLENPRYVDVGWMFLSSMNIGGDGYDVRHYEVVAGYARRPQDVAGWRPRVTAGDLQRTIRRISRIGCSYGPTFKPIRTGRPEDEKNGWDAHCDTLQTERSDAKGIVVDPAFKYFGDFLHEDCADFASSNALYLVNVSENITFRNVLGLGGEPAWVLYPTQQGDYGYNRTPTDPRPNGFSGAAVNARAFDSIFCGSFGSTKWTEVRNSKVNYQLQATQQPTTPSVNGQFVTDTSISNWTAADVLKLLPYGRKQNDLAYQASIWTW